jgi:PAS domain S-box-containing protein
MLENNATESKRAEIALKENPSMQAALRASAGWLAGHAEAFQAAMNGAPLETALEILARTAREALGEEVRCGFYIADEEVTQLRHVVGMPDAYAECVDGFRIGPDSLACGLAVYTGRPVITPDVQEDPRWKEWLWLSEKYEYRGCWSFPIETLTGKVVGTLAMYFERPRDAQPREIELATSTAQAAAIIIARHQEAEERARAEALLRESEQRSRRQSAELRAVLESMSDAVYIGNGDGISIANQAALDQLGYATAEELRRDVSTLSEEIQNRDPETGLRIADKDLPFVRALGGEQAVREVRLRHLQSGEDRIVRSAASPVKIDGQIIGAVAVNTDITKERRAQDALRQAEKLAVVGRLASSIAHEINNPLEAVINLIYLAEGAAISPETRGYLQQAQAELARVTHIASETLRFHRQNREEVTVDLSSIFESVIALHEGRLRAGQIVVNRRYRRHAPLMCFANELRQMAANLISNAIDAMNGHRRTLFLRVREAHDPLGNQKGVRLTVADTGVGMNRMTRSRIFEPFFTTKEHTGTGLGLWVTRSIVEKHKGRMSVRSRTGACSGTVFSIFLPNLGKTNQRKAI